MNSRTSNQKNALVLGGLMALATLCVTGCQVSIGGQTLPSAFYMYDDIQYFPKGPEFKLSREAAALKAVREQRPAPRR